MKRRVSEDIASLDSWSEALSQENDKTSDATCTSPVSYSTQNSVRRRSGGTRTDSSDNEQQKRKSSNQMILDPSRLASINDSDLQQSTEEDHIDVIYHEADSDGFYIENDVDMNSYPCYLDESRCYSSLPETVNDHRSFTYMTNLSSDFESLHEHMRPNLVTSAPNGLYSWPSAENIGSHGARTYPPRHKLPSKLTVTQPLEENVDQTERVKNKLKSFVNNMKYGKLIYVVNTIIIINTEAISYCSRVLVNAGTCMKHQIHVT